MTTKDATLIEWLKNNNGVLSFATKWSGRIAEIRLTVTRDNCTYANSYNLTGEDAADLGMSIVAVEYLISVLDKAMKEPPKQEIPV